MLSIVLISLFSILLWGFVSLSEDYYTSVRIPIKFIGLSEGYTVNSKSVTEVSFSLQGKGWQLAQIYFGSAPDFKLSVQRKTGRNRISVKKAFDQNNWLSKNFKVVDYVPSEIIFTVERIKIKKVKISPKLEIEFLPGYDITSGISVIPDSIEISGPESLVDKIDSLTTEITKFTKVDEDFSERVNLEPIKNISFKFPVCHVEFEVQKITDRTFENVIVKINNMPVQYDLKLSPPNIKVTLKGGINILAGLTDDDIQASVEFSLALSDTLGSIEPVIVIPPATTIIDIKPKRLNYIIKQF
ncbi:MAG: CdaR family protein [bacterium]